jgi:glycosyltransferase involved in cell wall biosynthesis
LTVEQNAWLNRWQQRAAYVPQAAGGKILGAMLIEHIGMGWLAAKKARSEGWTHLHFHNSFIALGYLFGSDSTPNRARFGITHHSFMATNEAIARYFGPIRPWFQQGLKVLERWVVHRADWLIAPTTVGLVHLAERLEITSIPQCWHALPHPRPCLPLPLRTLARQRLGWQSDDLHVVGIGQLIPMKGHDRIIAACGYSRYANKIHLTLLGEGDSASILAASPSRRRLTITATDDVGLYLAAADIYMSASETESFGIANLEAMYANLPCICTAVGAVPEVMGDAAILVNDLQPEVLAMALDRLIEDPELQADLRRRCQKRIASWPTAKTIAHKLRCIYNSA